MDTASGQADTAGARRTRPRRRLPLSPLAMGILALLLVLAFGAMILVLTGVYPPQPSAASQSVADVWAAARTATPASVRADMLKIEKVGAPQKQNDQVIVKLKVTNNVMQSAAIPGTPTPNAITPTPSQAEVYNGIIRVFFYKTDDKGVQQIVGSGIGSVVNLPFGKSQEITVTASGVGDYTDYVAFPESVWTDKDPVKPTEVPTSAPTATTK